MRAVKGNKEYTINEAQKSAYAESGFDILAENGDMIERGRGKTVPYQEYEKALKKIRELEGKEAPSCQEEKENGRKSSRKTGDE